MNVELENLKKECENCNNCELHNTRNNIVFGEGSEHADIFIIGEAPGENEDLQSRPFVGRSGKLLDKLLAEEGFSREKNVYIANMIKCRPPKNRDPKPEEIKQCSGYLKKQIDIVKPKVILCLGRVAASNLIDKNFKVTKQHGGVFNIPGYSAPVIPTFHPAALLRNPNNIPLFKEDLKKIHCQEGL